MKRIIIWGVVTILALAALAFIIADVSLTHTQYLSFKTNVPTERYPATATPTRAQIFCRELDGKVNPRWEKQPLYSLRILTETAPTNASFAALQTLYKDVMTNKPTSKAAIRTVENTIAAVC